MVALRSEIEGTQAGEGKKSIDELIAELAALAFKVDIQPNPKKADVEALSSFISKHPEVIRRMRALVTETLSRVFAHQGIGAGSQIIRATQLARLRTKLGYDEATELERLLIERVVMCWLRVNFAEQDWARKMTEGTTIREADFRDKILTRAHRRFESACETLSRVRQMQGPGSRSNKRATLALLKPLEAAAAPEHPDGD